MIEELSSRDVLLIYIVVSIVVLISGSIAGAGSYALLFDNETDDAGTISFVDQAAVSFKAHCTKADVTPDNGSDFDMTVTLVDGRSESYNEDDFNADPTFEYDTRNHFDPGPENIDYITLDGVTYDSNCE